MSLHKNVRYAVRQMSRKPFFTAAIVLTLGVCIGAVTAVFSVVDATLLRPLPFPEPDRLAQLVIRFQFEGRGGLQQSQNGATWEEFSKSARTIDFCVYSGGVSNLNFSSGGEAGYIRQQRVASGFFQVFGIPPMIGREFTPEEDLPNGPQVAILGHRLWQRAFGSDRAGCCRPKYRHCGAVVPGCRCRIAELRIECGYMGSLRAPSPSWAVRTAGPAESPQRQIEEAVKSVDPFLPIASFRTLTQIKLRSLALQRFTAMLLGIAACLALLLAAIGIYAMISNSVAERTREFGIRLALGATVSQTIRNSARPGLICASVGLVGGLILARWGARLLQGMLYGITPVDHATYAAVGAGVLVVVALASLIPALRIMKVDPSQSLRGE